MADTQHDESGDHRRGTVPRRGERAVARAVRVVGDALTVRRGFGEPIRQGDVTIIPVGRVLGGGGSGYGTGETELGTADSDSAAPSSGTGGGGGLGVWVRPLGVYVVDGHDVTWRPAVDVNRIVLGGQLVGVVAVLALALAFRRRR